NPVTEVVLGGVAEGGKEEVNQAVTAARQTLKGEWGSMPVKKRSNIIRNNAAENPDRQEELAVRSSLDTAKLVRDTTNVRFSRAANTFSFFAYYMTTGGTEA